MKTFFVAILSAIVLSACSGRDTEQKVELESLSAKQTPFLLNGKSIERQEVSKNFKVLHRATFERADASVAAYVPVRNIVYSNWDCEASWNQRCQGEVTIEAWPGWQICGVVFNVNQQGGHDAWLSVTPTNWYVNDPESPDRFRAVRLQIHAFGNGNPFDKRGSRMWVSNVGVTMIPAIAVNYDRYQSGCLMPAHD